jgi:hypothetical protein
MLLKLIYDEPLSTFGFKINMRRYTMGLAGAVTKNLPVGRALGRGLHASTL